MFSTVFLLFCSVHIAFSQYENLQPDKPEDGSKGLPPVWLNGLLTRNAYDSGWYEEYIRKNKTGEGDWHDSQEDHAPPWNHQCPKDVIHERFRGHGYFFSWKDHRSSNLRMTWQQALSFCRARCLELVSVESLKEHKFLAKHIARGDVKGVWTSGRKCDFIGCEKQQHLQPVDVYGWFWEGSREQLPPTTDRFDTCWSHTGGRGHPQPDNEHAHKGGEHESCLAIENNAYNDGVSWHDRVCSERKPFICEQSDRRSLPYILI